MDIKYAKIKKDTRRFQDILWTGYFVWKNLFSS